MASRYVDVFISHKQEDGAMALALKRRIERLGATCWIDAEDEELDRIQRSDPVDYGALTDRIRERLRTCRCLIFAFSAHSGGSRWMPWELGFFDGRWGNRLIGLYDLDEGEVATPQGRPEGERGAIGIPEFVKIYHDLKPETLETFLQYARSTRALSDRADVDIDRWANLVAGMMRDPVNVSIDAWQFLISYQQALWRRQFGATLPDMSKPWLEIAEAARAALAPWARIMRPAAPGAIDDAVARHADASAVAEDMSRVVPQAPAFADALRIAQAPFGGTDPALGALDEASRAPAAAPSRRRQ